MNGRRYETNVSFIHKKTIKNHVFSQTQQIIYFRQRFGVEPYSSQNLAWMTKLENNFENVSSVGPKRDIVNWVKNNLKQLKNLTGKLKHI